MVLVEMVEGMVEGMDLEMDLEMDQVCRSPLGRRAAS
jgi:hypothetical protein